MAKATQSYTKTKTSVKIKPKQIPDGMVQCNVCEGLGYHKKPTRKKKK